MLNTVIFYHCMCEIPIIYRGYFVFYKKNMHTASDMHVFTLIFVDDARSRSY